MASLEFDGLNEQMLRRFLTANPDCATIFGKHDPYDGLLPHGGFKKIEDNLALLTEWERAAARIAGREGLSRDQRTSLEVLRMTLDMYKFVVEDYPLWKMRPDALENPGSAMLMMLVRDYAPAAVRMESMATRIAELPRYLEQYRGRFAGVSTPRIWTEPALDACRAFPAFLDTVLAFANAKAEAKVSSEIEKSISRAKEELRAHEEWLVAMLDHSVEEFAMGRDSYGRMLRIRGIGWTPEELLDFASARLGELRRERAAIAGRISKGGTVEEARRMVEARCPTSDDEALERTRTAVARAKEFVMEHDLVTVPPGCEVIVMRTPAFLKDATSSAATFLPAVFERSQDSVYLVTEVSDPLQFRSTWNYPAIETTAVHEAYPGHHLQGVLSNRKPWMHQLPHIIYTPETLSPPYESQEGWATYCESMMHEKGFLGSDEHAFGMLDYWIWTACRALSEVKLSCKLATVDEMVPLFVRETGCPRASAEADVKGFTRMPGYGICYLLGRHLVTGLKKDLRAELGGRFSEKRFHDLVAENGNLPFHILERMVRQDMVATAR